MHQDNLKYPTNNCVDTQILDKASKMGTTPYPITLFSRKA
jgi:hypothetical protein